MKLSVTIITLNEEANIARCLKSVQFADEVILIDSNSTDRTLEIAKEYGAQVFQNKFEGYGQQKNYAASLCKSEWVLNIDADEEVSTDLKIEIQEIISNPTALNLYRLNRLTQFCSRWIKHGGWHPDYVSRLCKKDIAVWTEPNVHEDLVLKSSGPIGKLRNYLHHYSFPTVESQVRTNAKYAALGAKDLIRKKKRKPYFFEILTRSSFKFFECYILKAGFLDGSEGFVIAVNAAHSMFMKYSIAYLGNDND